MKMFCLAAVVLALSTGCTTTEPTPDEKKAMAEYADGYAPTGTLIKRKTLNNESNLAVVNKTQLENDKNGVAATQERSIR